MKQKNKPSKHITETSLFFKEISPLGYTDLAKRIGVLYHSIYTAYAKDEISFELYGRIRYNLELSHIQLNTLNRILHRSQYEK